MNDGKTIKVNITQTYKGWAYSVNIGESLHKIGYGHDYNSAARLAKSGVKSAQKFLDKSVNSDTV